jgi:hypothetical protein
LSEEFLCATHLRRIFLYSETQRPLSRSRREAAGSEIDSEHILIAKVLEHIVDLTLLIAGKESRALNVAAKALLLYARDASLPAQFVAIALMHERSAGVKSGGEEGEARRGEMRNAGVREARPEVPEAASDVAISLCGGGIVAMLLLCWWCAAPNLVLATVVLAGPQLFAAPLPPPPSDALLSCDGPPGVYKVWRGGRQGWCLLILLPSLLSRLWTMP